MEGVVVEDVDVEGVDVDGVDVFNKHAKVDSELLKAVKGR